MEPHEQPAGTPAHISSRAVVPGSAAICAGAWIGDDVELGEDVSIGPGAVVGFPAAGGCGGPVRIGPGSFVAPAAYIEPAVTIAEQCRIGPGVMIRAGTSIGKAVSIGGGCNLMGNCRIGDYSMLHSEVHVCEHAILHAHCQIMPGVMLLNDPYPPTGLVVEAPVIGECAVIGVRSVIWPGVSLGYHAMVASMSEVKHDVPDYTLVRGCPAKRICDVRQIRTKVEGKWVYPYPWMRHQVEGDDPTRPLL